MEHGPRAAPSSVGDRARGTVHAVTPRRPSRQRLVRLAAVVAVLLAAGVVLRLPGLENADRLAGVLSLLVAVVSLLWPTRGHPRGAPGTFVAAPGPVLDALADRNLRRAWDEEWSRRRLHDPAPLPLRWDNDDELADHWQNIRRTHLAAEPGAGAPSPSDDDDPASVRA